MRFGKNHLRRWSVPFRGRCAEFLEVMRRERAQTLRIRRRLWMLLPCYVVGIHTAGAAAAPARSARAPATAASALRETFRLCRGCVPVKNAPVIATPSHSSATAAAAAAAARRTSRCRGEPTCCGVRPWQAIDGQKRFETHRATAPPRSCNDYIGELDFICTGSTESVDVQLACAIALAAACFESLNLHSVVTSSNTWIHTAQYMHV